MEILNEIPAFSIPHRRCRLNIGLAKVAVKCFVSNFFVNLNIRASIEV